MKPLELENISYQNLSERKDWIPQLANWYFAEWGHEVPNRTIAIEIADLEKSLQSSFLPIILIASYRGKLLGAGQIKWKEMSIYPEKEYWLGGVFIHKDYRGHGIAKQIINRLVDIAKDLQIDTLFLQTEHLEGGLYAQLNWKKLALVNYQNIQVLVMERHLKDN